MSLVSMLSEKCPNCKKNKVFFNPGNLLLFKIPKMHATCSKCGYLFEKEAGFFFGAMFVSYGLIVAEAVTLFVLLHTFLQLGFIKTFLCIIGLVTLLGTFNYRLSRIIWIYLFYSETD